VAGMIIITSIQSILAFMTVSPSLIKQYEILVDLAVVTNVIPYILSMSALDVLMKIEANISGKSSRGLSVGALIGAIYSIYACYAAGEQAMTGGAIVIFAGWIIYGKIQNRQYVLFK
jgi:putrescine:ornithine antiporter